MPELENEITKTERSPINYDGGFLEIIENEIAPWESQDNIQQRINDLKNELFFNPKIGDRIFVDRLDGLYQHWGIYAGDNKVIHFAPREGIETSSENAIVHETTMKDFLKGGVGQVDHSGNERYSPEMIVDRARNHINEKGYDLAFNNCEHFANYCATGIHESKQVDKVFDKLFDGIFEVSIKFLQT